MSVILADAINLGLSKMAEATPDTTYSKLASIQGWHIRQETYKDAQAQLTNAIHEQPITKYWEMEVALHLMDKDLKQVE